MPGGRESPGRRPRRKQRPEGEEKHFKKRPGPQAQKKHSQLKNPARRAERNVFEDTRLNAESSADTLHILRNAPRPSLMGAEEESSKRVASEGCFSRLFRMARGELRVRRIFRGGFKWHG